MSRAGRWAASAFIAWNIAVVLVTNSQYLPSWLPDGGGIARLMLPYARATRVLQRWALFCPEPRRHTTEYYFRITFRDGRQAEWRRPEPPLWDFLGRHHAANWQKLDTASNHMEDRHLWPGIARWVARQYPDAANPPARIELLDRVARVPEPRPDGNAWTDPRELTYAERSVFVYLPETGELRP